jgi:phosphate transport system substrate-binding protein
MRNRPILVVVALAVVAAACGGSGGNGGGSGSSGIRISGSSTVEPISAANAQKFNSANPDVAISVEGPGTGDGFKLFCAGETDISDASRPIKGSEEEACADAGVDYVELMVAIDGLSVVTSTENSAVECLGNEDLYALLGPESIGFDDWSDADALAGELGATHAPYPAAELSVTGPGEESGTYDSFVELVLEDIADERGEDAVTRPDYVASANDNVIVEGIGGSPASLGWVGYAFYINNADRLRAIAVEGDAGCVAPAPETIADGSYPIARPLYIYVNKSRAAANPAVVDYVDFYLSDEGLASVDETGYVRLADYSSTRSAWAGR